MIIQTKQDMMDFCQQANKINPFYLEIQDYTSTSQVLKAENI